MKKIALIFVLTGFLSPCIAQNIIKDSIFVRIDRLEFSKRIYHLNKGRIVSIHIDIRNQYNKTQGFMLRTGNSDLSLKHKDYLDRNVITYNKFNKLLNNNFLDVSYYTKIYFVLSRAKENYLCLEVTPILPEELIKQ